MPIAATGSRHTEGSKSKEIADFKRLTVKCSQIRDREGREVGNLQRKDLERKELI